MAARNNNEQQQHQYDSGPEVLNHQNYPEVVHRPPLPPPPHPSYGYGGGGGGTLSSKPEDVIPSPQTGYSASYAPSHLNSAGAISQAPWAVPAPPPSQMGPFPGDGERRGRGSGAQVTLCGCSLLVFVLSVIIAILSAAVVGLAAGTGIEANRANDATDRLQALQASVSAAGLLASQSSSSASRAAATTATTGTSTGTATSSTASATATAAAIDNGCSENAALVSGQTYTSFKLLGLQTFTMQCNKDVNGSNVMSLFTADFNTCMDACAGYTKNAPSQFGRSDNSTCSGVSFIPLWTTKDAATQGGAPGNCYLKKGGLTTAAFVSKDIGTPVHGAVVTG